VAPERRAESDRSVAVPACCRSLEAVRPLSTRAIWFAGRCNCVGWHCNPAVDVSVQWKLRAVSDARWSAAGARRGGRRCCMVCHRPTDSSTSWNVSAQPRCRTTGSGPEGARTPRARRQTSPWADRARVSSRKAETGRLDAALFSLELPLRLMPLRAMLTDLRAVRVSNPGPAERSVSSLGASDCIAGIRSAY